MSRSKIPHSSATDSNEPPRYLAINDFVDALQAFPADIVRQFTLLKEIDAKCVASQPELNHYISEYLKLADSKDPSKEKKTENLQEIRKLILTNLPCYEEKMTIANLATDLVAKHIDRINSDIEMIINQEIPKIIKYGPKNHPAVISDSKLPENKSVHSQRSESRREALAAKKNSGPETNDNKRSNNNSSRTRDGTPVASGRKRKPQNSSNNNTNNAKSVTPNPQTNYSVPTSYGGNALSIAASTNGIMGKPFKPEEQDKKRQKTNPKRTRSDSNENLHHGIIRNKDEEENVNEVYCICQQVSFGEMICCDNDKCKIQWFHLQCVGLNSSPRGTWYCDDCKTKYHIR